MKKARDYCSLLAQFRGYLLVISLFFSFSGGAQTPMPKMEEHQNPGCPINSTCSKNMGQGFQLWEQSLEKLKASQGKAVGNKLNKSNAGILDQQRLKTGMPIEVWSRPIDIPLYESAQFDSPCKEHTKAGEKKYSLGLILAQGPEKDPKTQAVHLRFHHPPAQDVPGPWIEAKTPIQSPFILDSLLVLSQGKDKSWQASHFWVPRDERPMWISKSEMGLVRYEGELYFELLVKKATFKKQWSIRSPLSNMERINQTTFEETPCPEQARSLLTPEELALIAPEGPYSDFECQKELNQSKETGLILMTPVQCR